jgi:peptidoglycan hydrolase-like protein with peptidoglycan-binding domain
MHRGYSPGRYAYHFRGGSRSRYRGNRRRWPWLGRGGGGFAPTPSPLVSGAQSCLAQLIGPWVPQDGILGAATRQAIIQFQNQQSLPPTGALDDATTQALQAACSPQPAIPDTAAAPPPPPPPPAPPAPQAPTAASPPPHPRRHGAPPTTEIGERELADQERGEAALHRRGRWVRHRGRIVLLDT